MRISLRGVDGGLELRDLNLSPSSVRAEEEEQVARALLLVFVFEALLRGARRQRISHLR
jgi:hypothetical protein